MSGNILHISRQPEGNVSTSYTSLHSYEPNEQGHSISFCSSVHKNGQNGFAVLFMAADGCDESFDVLAELVHSPQARAVMELTAKACDRAIQMSDMRPDNLEEGA